MLSLASDGVAPRLIRVHQMDPLAWAPLLAASESEGRQMLRRLMDEWRSGANRYEQPGESLWAWIDAHGQVIAVGGLNVEPPPGRAGTGRMRRFYVHPDWRGHGLAKRLVNAVLASAQGHFSRLHVNCEGDDSATFWTRCGFAPIDANVDVIERPARYTHVRLLPRFEAA
ncbi:GNAT family N-acetyltransferase [Mitsuaria sp. CC2]|uniref:GNAT family N-acetyltransferase n=1 Tax=Mitsuaria sp. CC2 TaxID=3029186 RepID=UPI003B8D540B